MFIMEELDEKESLPETLSFYCLFFCFVVVVTDEGRFCLVFVNMISSIFNEFRC